MPYWTADQDALLRKLWADPDISTTRIASEMGFASRNKVIYCATHANRAFSGQGGRV